MRKQKNVIEWKDIVKVRDKYYYFTFPIEFEDKKYDIILPKTEDDILAVLTQIDKYYFRDALYNCDNFFDCVMEELGCNRDDIETYCFDVIDIPEEYDPTECGGYINGVNI